MRQQENTAQLTDNKVTEKKDNNHFNRISFDVHVPL